MYIMFLLGLNKVNKLVFIKDLQIYGEVIYSWQAKNNKGEFEENLIIKDMVGIEHERFISEIEVVDDIETSIKKAKCNIPLEKILDLFNKIDKRFTVRICLRNTRDCGQGDYVNEIVVSYGGIVFSEEEKSFEQTSCIIRDGKLILPDSSSYICKEDEYECCVLCVDSDIKDVVFELYMNIVTRLRK